VIYRLTGITTDMLDKGICFEEAINDFTIYGDLDQETEKQ